MDFSVPIGKLIAEMGFNLLTGGGSGVMLKASEAFFDVANRRGRNIGIVPSTLDVSGRYIPNPGYPNRFVEIPIYTPLPAMSSDDPEKPNRNYVNILTSSVVVALPGNTGTRNEIELSLRFGKPLMLFCPEGFFHDVDKDVPRTDNIEEVRAFIKSKTA